MRVEHCEGSIARVSNVILRQFLLARRAIDGMQPRPGIHLSVSENTVLWASRLRAYGSKSPRDNPLERT